MVQAPCPVIVGRRAELSELRRLLDAAAAHRGRCAVLVGEPGIGKSRLAHEVAGWAATRGFAVLAGRAVPAAVSTPYRPLTDALLPRLRRPGLLEDPALSRWLPLLAPMLPTLVDHAPAREVPPSLRAEALLQVLARTGPAGMALVLEDVHWADPDTVAVVEYLAAHIDAQPLLVLLTLRDSPTSAALEMARRARGEPAVSILRLGRLAGDEVRAMVTACDPAAGEDVVRRVAETSEGVPLLVEELLASPGLPADFAETVHSRMSALAGAHRQVIEAAAVLGRHFDWRLLPRLTGQSDDAVGEALAAGVRSMLLASHGSDMGFRHALTREAILEGLVPPRQRQLAAAALRALFAGSPHLRGAARDVAVELALRAGDRTLAGRLLAESGHESLLWGALGSAVESLRRAADLLDSSPERARVELELVEALALAGRVEEAAASGGRLISRLGAEQGASEIVCEAHLRLAQAGIGAARWQMARHHLDHARRLATQPSSAVRVTVLDADLLMAEGDDEGALRQAERVLAAHGAAPDVRCHAYEIVGRSRRSTDLVLAREAFEAALVTAEASDLPLWRLRALHELGTIDLFDHAGVDRLLQARQAAEGMGALSTAAILDLQLAAAFTARWDLEACDAHARSAIAIAERLGLGLVRAKGLVMLAGSAGMRADLPETERLAQLTKEAAPEDAMLEGFSWGMRGMARLLHGDDEGAVVPYARGMAILGRLPHAEPAALRALWPVLLAARRDRRAQAAIDEARRLGVGAFRLNRAMLGYADAILAGRRGEVQRARELVERADTDWTNVQGWADLTRLLAAPAAARDGWADPAGWLVGAAERFTERGLPVLAARSRERSARANPWSSMGITGREADVLRLVSAGLGNKEIARRLHLSPRTVEKHVESLLRKGGCRSRTELVARLARADAAPPAATT